MRGQAAAKEAGSGRVGGVPIAAGHLWPHPCPCCPPPLPSPPTIRQLMSPRRWVPLGSVRSRPPASSSTCGGGRGTAAETCQAECGRAERQRRHPRTNPRTHHFSACPCCTRRMCPRRHPRKRLNCRATLTPSSTHQRLLDGVVAVDGGRQRAAQLLHQVALARQLLSRGQGGVEKTL